MLTCAKCGSALSNDANYCQYCGKAVKPKQGKKRRGNGQGSVYPTPSGKYLAIATIGYYLDEAGSLHRKTRSKVFAKKSDAIAALPGLHSDPRRDEKRELTFKQLYDLWLPTHRAGPDTMACYKAAVRYLEPVWMMRISDIDIDDLQDCLDSCPKGKRTRQNMRTLAGLVYKYGIPRHVVPENLNLAQYLTVEGEGPAHRASFTDLQIERIRQTVGKVYGAEQVLMMIYLGFRLSEFLELTVDQYNAAAGCFIGGAKTAAGKNRIVTVSPKIAKYVAAAVSRGPGPVIRKEDGRPYTRYEWGDAVFYPVLEAAGIENPMVKIAGAVDRHMYTPHTCRHTFATLMKRVAGASRDKQELIGHASEEMLKYYQDVDVADLKKITDAL